MSAIQPIVDIPIPNYAAEEAARPYDPDQPVTATGATTGVAAIEAEEDRSGLDYPTAQDASDISKAARALAEATRSETEFDREADYLDGERLRGNRGIRELIRSFENYNNGAAIAAYNNYLNMFVRYGATSSDSDENSTIAALRAQENAVYDNLGISHAEGVTRENREGINGAIDRWFVGEGVFFPAMLHYTSSDGFSFTPLTAEAKAAARANDVTASYDRSRIATYLREMAQLTPRDFMFFDSTGLGELGLQERRDFLRRMDELLDQAGIDARAADLRYIFDEEGRIQLEELGLDQQYETRLDQLRDEINTYYGELRYSVHQYKAGIISAALA